jgi:hypothetical protein
MQQEVLGVELGLGDDIVGAYFLSAADKDFAGHG